MASEEEGSIVTVVLLAGLAQEAGGRKKVQVNARTWREALTRLRQEYPGLRRAIREDGEPEAGYMVFVDGVDYRLRGDGPAREVVVLPVNHGGGSLPQLHYVSWEDVERASDAVASMIDSDGWRPDVVVGILRGGIVPARLIADRLGVEDLAVVEVKLYRGVGVRREKPYIRQPLVVDVLDKKVLVVDDVSDTGLTLQVAVNAISMHGPTSIRTAALYVKPWTKFVPDYYAAQTDKWVVFPWEKEETRRELSGRT